MATISIKCRHISNGTLPQSCVRCGDPAVTKRFPWVSDPSAASWYLSRKMKVFALLFFWAFILWQQYVRPEVRNGNTGLPFCDRHRNYWLRRAWFVVDGFVALVLLFVLALATDPSLSDSGHRQVPNLLTMIAVFWMLIYPLGFLIVHMSSMRVIRHDGLRVTLVGVSKRFITALKNSLPEYAEDKRPTHWEELRQMVSDYVR